MSTEFEEKQEDLKEKLNANIKMKRELESEENGRDKRWEKQKLELELKKKEIDELKLIISRPRIIDSESLKGFKDEAFAEFEEEEEGGEDMLKGP